MKRRLLFIHGAGEGAHEEDRKMAASLRDELGSEYDVQTPKMPDEDRPEYEAWRDEIAKKISAIDDEVILVGHSLGASILLKYLSEEDIVNPVAGMFLIATPFWDAERFEEYALREDFASKLPGGLTLFFYHSRDDEWVPFEHLALYRENLPLATVREFDGRGHQFDDDLSEVARDIQRS